jgi:hypothetical protein
LVSRYLTNKLIGREALPKQNPFLIGPCDPMGASGISPPFEGLSQTSGQVPHVLLTRSPLGRPQCCHWLNLVRLACVRHAASVRPEPGSNSPSKTWAPPLATAPVDREHPGPGESPEPRYWHRRVVGTTRQIDGALLQTTTPEPGGPEAIARTRSLVLSSVFKERHPLAGTCSAGSVGAGTHAAVSAMGRAGRRVNLTSRHDSVNLRARFHEDFCTSRA